MPLPENPIHTLVRGLVVPGLERRPEPVVAGDGLVEFLGHVEVGAGVSAPRTEEKARCRRCAGRRSSPG